MDDVWYNCKNTIKGFSQNRSNMLVAQPHERGESYNQSQFTNRYRTSRYITHIMRVLTLTKAVKSSPQKMHLKKVIKISSISQKFTTHELLLSKRAPEKKRKK